MRFSRAGLIGAITPTLAAAMIGLAGPAAAAPPAPVYAFGAEVQVGGQSVVPPTPTAAVTPFGDESETTIDIPASPVAVNGTLRATANAHQVANIATGLTVVEQTVKGPYRARALAEIENVGVLYDIAGADIPILSAAAVRAEAAAVCTTPAQFTANSEIIDLRVGGEPIPLNAPVQDLVDAISGALTESGLNAVVDVQRNVVTRPAEGGIAVDALVVTILSAAGDTPLAVVRLAHAELTAGACVPVPQCSDTADNDGDGVADTADPGCHTDGNAANPATYDPKDDDERNRPQCSDTADNDSDGVADAADPGCHTDGNPANAASYDPNDDDERNGPGELPATGGTLPLWVGAGVLGLGAMAMRLRRQLIS